MPPQVGKTGEGSRPISTPPTGNVEEIQSPGAQKVPEQKEPSAGKEAAAPYRASPKEVSARKAELGAQTASKKASLNAQLKGNSALHDKSRERPDGLWQTMKKTAHFVAVDSFNKAGRAVDSAVADAAFMNAANQANDHLMKGVARAKDITIEKKGQELAADIKRLGSGKPSFEEKEQLIQKISEYRRQASETQLQQSPIFTQETMRAPAIQVKEFGPLKYEVKVPEQVLNKFEHPGERMTGGLTTLLGPYGYHWTNPDSRVPGEDRGTTPTDMLDTALHNWRATKPEDRLKIHNRKPGDPPPIMNHKNWKAAPDAAREDLASYRKEVVLNQPLPGNYGNAHWGTRESEPDIDVVDANAKKNFTDVSFNTINSMYPSVAAPEPTTPKAPPGPGMRLSTAPRGPYAKGGGPHDTTQPAMAYENTGPRQPAAANTGRAPASQRPAGNGTLVDSEPAISPAQAARAERERKIIERNEARARTVAGANTAAAEAARTLPGPNQSITPEQALQGIENQGWPSMTSMNTRRHAERWRELNPNHTAEPPIAYRDGNQIRLDYRRLTPEQQRRYEAIAARPDSE